MSHFHSVSELFFLFANLLKSVRIKTICQVTFSDRIVPALIQKCLLLEICVLYPQIVLFTKYCKLRAVQSSREDGKHVLLSECNADISAYLVNCHLSKCSDVTEAESGNSTLVENSARGYDHLPEAPTLTSKILERSKIVPISSDIMATPGKLQMWRAATS